MSLEGQSIGRYKLQRLLGSGGMGEVYLATDTSIKRQVAIKVIRTGATTYPGSDAAKDAARLFQREMRAIAMLDHPNILPLFDYGEEIIGGTTINYMVMPYRKEGSLADWLRQRNHSDLLSPHDVGYFLHQAAKALHYAHTQQIIHQDVKPSNFLIRREDDQVTQPDLLLTDFGVAKFINATSSISHTVRGTPTYMAPEQWEGSSVPATDQYALAIMAYELLVGRPPFQGGLGPMMYQHLNVQPQSPSKLNPAISKDIDYVLLQALSKKSEARFASIAAFANAFQQALQSTETTAAARFQSVKSKAEERQLPSSYQQNEELIGTVHSDSRKAQLPSAVPADRRSVSSSHRVPSRGIMILLISIVAVIVAGSLGFFFLTRNAGLPNPYSPYTGTLALDDSLSGNTLTWFQVTDNRGGCEFRESSYRIYMQAAAYRWCTNGVSNFSDFAYQIHITITKGSIGGMIFRCDDPGKNCYFFGIGQDGSYELDLVNNGIPQSLKRGSNPAINTGLNQPNEIAVVAQGSTFDLYVNLHKIDSINDSTYTSGQIGVAGTSTDTPTEVAFNNAQVWKL